jgi:tetratricopeptide (TPR) repeat protein
MSDLADVPSTDPTAPRPQVDMHADRGGTTVYQNPGTIQTTVYNYNQPQLIKHWQVPAPPVLDKTFVGREEELRQLMEYLTAGEDVAIVGKAQALTLQGMGGIGKTYLALKLANELYDRFPGGVLWIVVGPQVIDEASAQSPLSRLASSAFDGITPIGQLDPEQVRAWLQETAPGPFLVIFDDVWSQVSLRFLARALPANAVRLVTTRYVHIPRILGGKMIPLDRLTPEDGLALLEDRLGCQGNTTYRTDLEELVKLLDGHALALDITAARIPDLSWIPIVLKDLKKGIGLSKLDGLKLSEERDLNVEKSLGLTYDRMTPEQQSRFRALGVFAPETPITPEAAAAIWDLNGEDATQDALFYLRDLANLALLTEVEKPPTSIYRQHGLLRVYAYALLEKEDELTSTGRAHAQYYTELAVHTEIADYPLLDQHIPNLLAALHWSAANERVLLSEMLEASFQLLLVRGQSERIEGYLPNAVAAAAENPVRQANLLKSLGELERRLGNLDQARDHYDAALPLYRAERARLGEANVYKRLAEMFLTQKEWLQARTYYEQALPLYLAERDPLGQAGTLIGLGQARFELGDHEQGMQDVQQAAALFHFVQDEEWAQRAERYLAEMRIRLEHPEIDTELFEALINFAEADWTTRRQLLGEHSDFLLSEQVEPLCNGLVQAAKEAGDSDAIQAFEQLRTTLRDCRQWGIDAVEYFEPGMRLGDGIDIPSEHESAVMQIATLLSHQVEDNTALEQAIEAMQALLNRLTTNVPPLFEAALLRDLADAMLNLPADHLARKLDEIEACYREALPSYQAADRPLAVTRIQRALGDVLNEQGRYDEASEALQSAIDGLRKSEENKNDLAWVISAYAGALDNLGRTEEALAAYSEAIELLPDTPPLLRNRAETLIHLRRLDEAEADLARAAELDGNEDSPYLWFRRAQIAIARGDGTLADQMLDEVLKRDPTHDVALQRAQSAWLRGELNAAQEALQQALAKANAGEQATMRRDMERLLNEHPDLPGGSLLDTL